MNGLGIGGLEGRHPGAVAIARWFAHDHLPAGPVRGTSAKFSDLAEELIRTLPDGPELTAGLRKLLEAKDCFVRGAIDHHERGL